MISKAMMMRGALTAAVLLPATLASADTIIDFAGFNPTGHIYSAGAIPVSVGGAWSSDISGFQFKNDENVDLLVALSGDAGGAKGMSFAAWQGRINEMKATDDSSFYFKGYTELKNSPWAGGDYTWTVTGYDAVTGGNVLYSETFTSTTTPTAYTLTPTEQGTAVKRVEWSGWTTNPESGSNGPGLVTDLTVATVPEPGTLALLAWGGVALLRRRKFGA